MYKNLFLLVVISFFLYGCGGDVISPDPDVSDVDKAKAKAPRTIRLEYAKQLIQQAGEQKPPKQNQTYFEVISMLFKHQPGGAEYRLIEEVLGLINRNQLTPHQHDQWIIDSGRLHFQRENYYMAQQVLEQELQTRDLQILTWYHSLRGQLYDLGQQNIEAIQEMIKLHPLLVSEEEKTTNLEAIWNVLSRFSLQQLEKDIGDDTFGQETQLLGWQQLAYLIKSTPNQYQLNKKLRNWQVNFPRHMASYTFIQAQLKKRFELLLDPQQIAILMPTSGKLSKPAQTIRNGVLAAHFQLPLNNQLVIRFYDTSQSSSIWPIYKKAVYEGAEAVIGPLTKKHLRELNESDDLPVPTLALNQVKGEQVTKNLFQFGLVPEDEAIQVARIAKQEGHRQAAILVPDTAWGKRLKKSFSEQWQNQGGLIVESQFYKTKTHDFSDPIKKLLNLDESVQRQRNVRQVLGKKVEFTPRIRQDLDMIFLAAFPKQARQIPLQVSYYHGEDIPIYATSHIIAKVQDIKANKDLNGIHYTDMPWMLDTSVDAISRKSQTQRASYQRLFALGVDTYLVLPYLNFLSQNRVEFFQGETGLLSVLPDGKVNRKTPMGSIKNGNSFITKQARDTVEQADDS